jgi:protein-disulfide isomerase
MSQKSARKTRSAQRKAPPPVKSGRAKQGIPRKWLYAGAAGVAIVVVVVLVVASLAGGDGGSGNAPPFSVAGEQTEQLLSGIPQEGTSLGSAGAPVTMTEFADLQCPYCQRYQLDVLPTLIEEYVRSGDVRLVFNGMGPFLGPDSETAHRAVLAAGLQNKAWNVADLLYVNQGNENEGWVTDELLRAVGEAVPGLDVDKMLADMQSDEVSQQMQQERQQAADLGVHATPTFFVTSGDGQPQPLAIDALTPDAFRAALDQQLSR